MGTAELAPAIAEERYRVEGMTCGACLVRVEQALRAVPGVRRTKIDVGRGTAVVEREVKMATPADLARAVSESGYGLYPLGDPAPRTSAGSTLSLRPFLVATVAALTLLGLYLGVATLAQGWDHAQSLFREDAGFVVAIAAGFGVQAGLFVHMRARQARASGKTLAASGGTSTATMLACCAHHLVDVAPLVGFTGVATLLGAYKFPLLWLGVVSNGMGIAYLLYHLRRCGGVAKPH